MMRTTTSFDVIPFPVAMLESAIVPVPAIAVPGSSRRRDELAAAQPTTTATADLELGASVTGETDRAPHIPRRT